jgi:hypothetical protein
MPNASASSTDRQEATEPEDDGDYEAHIGAPLAGDYLARLSREVDRLARLTREVAR